MSFPFLQYLALHRPSMVRKSPKNKAVDSSGTELPDDSMAAKETGKEGNRDDEGGALESEHLYFKRVRHYDSDRAPTVNPVDMHKISRYLMAVKDARARTIFRIVEEDKLDGEKNLAWIRHVKASHLRKVDESELRESSLFRWIGCQSVELEVHGSMPATFNGFSVKTPPARKVEKEPKKRGRPRIHPQPEKSLSEPRKPRGRPPKVAKFEKPITLNERLQSLVDESIAQRLLTEKRKTTDGIGRRTNNSLNVSLETTQQERTVLMSTAQQPFKIPKKHSQTTHNQLQKSPSLVAFKRPKVEPSDFELPANFRNESSAPSTYAHVLEASSQRNSFQWAADRPCTSTSVSAARLPLRTNISETNREGTIDNRAKSSSDKLKKINNREPTEKQFPIAQKSNGAIEVEHRHKERGIAEADKKMEDTQQRTMKDGEASTSAERGKDETAQTVRAQLSIFTARSFHYEVDVATAVMKRFQSAQVVDIFNSLPPPNNPRLKKEADNGHSHPSSVRIVDHLELRQNKHHHRTAQALFCGGPLSALAICPRTTRSGRELLAVGTFTDETMLAIEKEGSDAFVQLWTTDPKKPNETARFECLLRVPKARHICSLNWCPILDDDFESFRKSDVKFAKESLGLLAVGTYSGQINIYNVSTEIESIVSHGQNNSGRKGNALPPVFELDPMFTLYHPMIDPYDRICGTKSSKEATKGNHHRQKEQQQKTTDQREPKLEAHFSMVFANDLESSVPLFCLNWSPFSGGRHIGAVSPIGFVFVWDLARSTDKQITWKLHFNDSNSPPQSICWTEKNKICISFRRRFFRVYDLLPPTEPNQPILECDLNKTCGTKCCSQPLLFPGMIGYESSTFSYFGTSQQAPSYIWVASSPDNESEMDQICATTLSNCHQIQNTCVSVCPLAGLCASVGADGRMACSLNGRMAPNEGGDGENLMHGRTLLHLIMHDKSPPEDEKKNFCFSHNDCCNHRRLEIRLGDCALLDQDNERVCRRRAPEVCPGRRLESLTLCEFSRRCAGLTYCGGESGFLFVVPCTL